MIGGVRPFVQQLLAYLRRWLWLVAAISLIPTVLFGARLRPTYTATARVQITTPPEVDVPLYQLQPPFRPLSDDLTAARANFMQVAFSPDVRNRTVTSIGLANADFAYVAVPVSVPGSSFVDIRVTARTAEAAARTANAHAEASMDVTTELRAAQAQAAVDFLKDQLDASHGDPDQYAYIRGKLDEAQHKLDVASAAHWMQLAEEAVPPTSANTQQVWSSLGLLAVGGAVAGVLIAKLLDFTAGRAARRIRPRLTRMGGGLLACAVVAALTNFQPLVVAPQLPLLAVGGPAVWVLWKRPELGILGVVTLAAGLLPPTALYVPLGVGGVFGYDVILLAVLGVLALRGLVREGLRIDWWPVSKPLLVFLGLSVASVVYAISQDVDPARALNEFRPIFYYGASIAVALALTRSSHRTTLLVGLFILCDVVSAALIVQQFVGARSLILPGMIFWQVNEVGAGGVTENGDSLGGSGFGLVRIVPPANVLMFAMMIVAFIWSVAPGMRGPVRWLSVAQFLFLNVGLLLTYTRAQWIASVIAIGIIAMLAPRAVRRRVGKAVLAAAAGIACVIVLFVAGLQLPGSLQPAIEAMVGRATSILSPDETLSSSSLQWRAFENEAAIESLLQSPQGVGLGNAYRPITTYAGEAAGYQGSPLNGFMHNSYMYIAVKTGVQGLLAFLWLCGAFLLHGWRLFRRMPDGPVRWLVLGLLASFVGNMQWSITEPNFMQIGATVTVGVMVGLLASLSRECPVAVPLPETPSTARVAGRHRRWPMPAPAS